MRRVAAPAPCSMPAPPPASGVTSPRSPTTRPLPGARSAPATGARLRRAAIGDALREHFHDPVADDVHDVVAYCGSGVSACPNILAIEHAGSGRRASTSPAVGLVAAPSREAATDGRDSGSASCSPAARRQRDRLGDLEWFEAVITSTSSPCSAAGRAVAQGLRRRRPGLTPSPTTTRRPGTARIAHHHRGWRRLRSGAQGGPSPGGARRRVRRAVARRSPPRPPATRHPTAALGRLPRGDGGRWSAGSPADRLPGTTLAWAARGRCRAVVATTWAGGTHRPCRPGAPVDHHRRSCWRWPGRSSPLRHIPGPAISPATLRCGAPPGPSTLRPLVSAVAVVVLGVGLFGVLHSTRPPAPRPRRPAALRREPCRTCAPSSCYVGS